MIPALIPSCSAWLPSVAETWVWLISFRSIGRAPICRIVARSCASWMLLKPPEISAPVRPSIPSGFSAKLMIGRVLTSLSRTTAKWPERAPACWALTGPIACAWPRWAILRVTSWKASRPLSVKPKVTFGWLSSPKFCFGSVMSVPESDGLSFSAYQPGSAVWSVLPSLSLGCSETSDGPDRDFDDDPVVGPLLAGRADVEALLRVFGTGDQLVRGLAFEEVEARLGGRAGGAVGDRRLLRRRAGRLRRRSGRRRRRSAAGSRRS